MRKNKQAGTSTDYAYIRQHVDYTQPQVHAATRRKHSRHTAAGTRGITPQAHAAITSQQE